MKYLKEYSNYEELADSLGKLHHSIRGMLRNALPEDIYKDYFLELEEIENFYVRLNKGNGFVTSIDMEGMIDLDKIESEFYRIVKKMTAIKDRLIKIYDFDCHFMVYLNGKGQQENNPITHKNDIYKFFGVGNATYGRDRNYYYREDPSNWDLNRYEKFPKDKVAISIKFMII